MELPPLEEIYKALSFKEHGSGEIRDINHPKQDQFVMNPATFLEACCTRRAGKSSALAIKFFRTMKKYPGQTCRYIALTRDSAKDIMWPVLQELDQKFSLNAVFTESNLTMTIPKFGNARLKLYGADMKNFIRRLRGVKNPAVAIDETQDFGDHIKSLVDDVLTATISDYPDGWLAVTGTPGPLPMGYFYEITQLKKYGFSHHSWSCYENPYMPNAKAFVEKLKRDKGWSNDNPTLLREWHGQWVKDLDALVYNYDETKNHYDQLPPENYIYIMGVDFGFIDADAISVLGWSEKSPVTYLVYESIVAKQGITELVNQIESLRRQYNISKIVADFGGLGKKIGEEISRRWQTPMVPAEKIRKAESIEIFNDALRTSRFMAKKTSRFAHDAQLLKWDQDKSTPERKVISDRFHSDILDATLYAFRESPAYSWQPEPVKPKYGTPQWAEAEVEEMERQAEEHFKALEDETNEWPW